MPEISKKEADAYDKVLEAAADLAELIASGGIDIDEYDLEELTIFLAKNAPEVKRLLKSVPHRLRDRLTESTD